MLDTQVKKQFKSWTAFAKNLKHTIMNLFTILKRIFGIKEKPVTFADLKTKEFFIIEDEFGNAEFMKTTVHQSICIKSNDCTYEKSRDYYIQEETIVKPTSRK